MDGVDSMLLLLVIVAGAAMYFTNRRELETLRNALKQHTIELVGLRRQIAELTRPQTPPAVAAVAETKAEPTQAPAIAREPAPVAPPAAPPPIRTAAPSPVKRIEKKALEQQFGGRAFVWVGGVALALAGFYLVKYSIDTGLLTERVRIVLGLLFGLALLGGGQFVRARPTIANGTRISQALTGAGIADLYGTVFAATTLYHLVPEFFGFLAMAAITAAALVLALRHGAPIAALGLIGGYVTPILIGGQPNTPALFGYLYVMFTGLTVLIRSRRWWWLAIPATLVALAWVVVWLFTEPLSSNGPSLSLFLLAVAATAAFLNRDPPDAVETKGEPLLLIRNIAPTGTVALLGLVTYTNGFGLFEWTMFGLLSLGALLLAWFDGRTYRFVPWQAMAVNLVMLVVYSAEPTTYGLVIAGFALLFAGGSQVVLARSTTPVLWAALSASAIVLYFLLAYDELHVTLAPVIGGEMTWAAIAFAAAAAMTAAAARPFVLQSEIMSRHRMQAIFAIAATGLIGLGFAIALKQQYLPFAIAVELLAVSWIATRVDVPALDLIAPCLAAVFGLLLLPDLGGLLGDALGQPVLPIPGTGSIVNDAVFRFGLPAAMFAGASWFQRQKGNAIFVAVLEIGAVFLITATLYQLLHAAFIGHPADETLVLGSIFTNIVLLLAIGVLRLADRYTHDTLFWAGAGLVAFALVRVVALSLVLFDPLWSHQSVGALLLANGLLAVFALPALLFYGCGRELKGHVAIDAPLGGRILAFVLGFIWLTLAVRQAFNGRYLDNGVFGNAEAYAYSAAWLVLGVALLFAAAIRKDMTLRIASLVVMVLTVGKVFLYDASQLTGLWRVVSFLGLGLSLLGLSWFYSRFIFGGKAEETPA